jgi:tRNA(fMet)-specific endonuclease VapC
LKKYLLDTNICIFYLKGRFDLDTKVRNVGVENCFISEITVAELKFGAENSEHVERNRSVVTNLLSVFQVIPVFGSLDVYAKEKARLRKQGDLIDDFDLLIGATAIANELIMVTNNTKHFVRMDGMILEDWTL